MVFVVLAVVVVVVIVVSKKRRRIMVAKVKDDPTVDSNGEDDGCDGVAGARVYDVFLMVAIRSVG